MGKILNMILQWTHLVLCLRATKMHIASLENLKKGERIHKKNQNLW